MESKKAEHAEAERGWWWQGPGGGGREFVKVQTFSYLESTTSGHLTSSTLSRVHETTLQTSHSLAADLQCFYHQNNFKGDHMRWWMCWLAWLWSPFYNVCIYQNNALYRQQIQFLAVDMNLGRLREMVRDREAWRVAFHGVVKRQTWLGDWATGK